MVRELVKEDNSEFKPVKLRLKIDIVSYPAQVEGLVNRVIPLLVKTLGIVPQKKAKRLDELVTR